MLYGSASYRLSDLTERAALGELLALIFIPLAFLGVWIIFNGQAEKFYILSIGMSFLILSHLLSAFIFALFIFFYLLLNMDRLLEEKKRIAALLKAVLLTLLLSAGFLLPMGEQMLEQTFNFQTNQMARLGEQAGSFTDYFQVALRNSGYNNPGLLLFVLLVLLIVRFKKLGKLSKQLALLAVFFLIASTNLVPYQLLEETVFHSLLNFIQFPWRFFMLVTFTVCWSIADSSDRLFSGKKKVRFFEIGILVASVLVICFHNLLMVETDRYKSRIGFEHISSTFLGWGSEYLPSGTDTNRAVQERRTILKDDNLSIEAGKFNYDSIEFDYEGKDQEVLSTVVLLSSITKAIRQKRMELRSRCMPVPICLD